MSKPAIQLREVVALALLVALSDFTIYRGGGYSGVAVLFAVAPVLFALRSSLAQVLRSGWLVWGLLALTAVRLAWCGSQLSVAVGAGLLAAWGFSLHGLPPFVIPVLGYSATCLITGPQRIAGYARFVVGLFPRLPPTVWLGILLPAAAVLAFGLIFLQANPDLLDSVRAHWERWFWRFQEWLRQAAFGEILFCISAAWIAAGLLNPLPELLQVQLDNEQLHVPPNDAQAPAVVFYLAARNTLVALIGLFAVYLVFEFQTLWFRTFPVGFHYSGYAHRGAAWLTCALALATGILSVIFSGGVLRDTRLPGLRRLAWIWSAQNLILAIATFHRLNIYVGFNGLTRMRIIGFFGTATVVAGLLLVIWKITHQRTVFWLVRRQLAALALAVILFAITPVDAIWVSYNVWRISAGDLPPSVELSEHPLDNEGLLCLAPLVECDNDKIRHGIRALLANRHDRLRDRRASPTYQHWSHWQAADHQAWILLERLAKNGNFESDQKLRKQHWEAFRNYAYQWY